VVSRIATVTSKQEGKSNGNGIGRSRTPSTCRKNRVGPWRCQNVAVFAGRSWLVQWPP